MLAASMRASAFILSLAVLTGCSARVVQQVAAPVSKWEEAVDQFWQHFVKLGNIDQGDVQIPDFGTKFDTLITASMYQLTTYIDNISTGQLSSDRDLQRLVTRLKGDMLNAKEYGIQSMRQQTKSMGQQDFHDLQSDIRAFTTALRHLLDKDIQDIRKYLSEQHNSQNPDTGESFVQQTGNPTSQRKQGQNHDGVLGQQRQNQDGSLGQQGQTHDVVPGQQRQNHHGVLGQQGQNQDGVLGQQRQNQDGSLGQQGQIHDEVLGQQRQNQVRHLDQI
ncbi:apolipoprotein Eb-like isoform X2 [Hippocampus comes]|uniref:apolipoprotein Eb-like isoform X2 n=1 Tax=Hippocampus comes TaxID=109280 RepID=UPI00094E1261|nr:PREDICTED: apolipoprotein Eb-like isoform X2 [Hippocampus comes]